MNRKRHEESANHMDSPANLRAIELKVLEHLSCAEDDSRKKNTDMYIYLYIIMLPVDIIATFSARN